MIKGLAKCMFCLAAIVGLNVMVITVRDYGMEYGSYKLTYSYYGMINNDTQNGSYPYVKLPVSRLTKLEDRLWIRHNLSEVTFKAPFFIDNRSHALFYANGENMGFLKAQPIRDYTLEVLFLRNGTFDVDKFCGYKGANDWINQSKDRKVSSWIPSFLYRNWYPILVPLRNRDGNTFQHFTDGTLHRIIQILPLLQNRTVRLLMRRPRDTILYEMLQKLRISSDQLVFHIGENPFGADLLIHSCIRNPEHPVLWYEARRLLGVPHQLNVPYSQAYVVVITRDGCVNCGRRILNLENITAMLANRYGYDVIKVFRGPETLESSLELFGNSRIILGPHGGGLYNMNFAPYGTTVIEFMPTKDDGNTGIPGHQAFWKISNVLYHDYWRVALPPDDDKNMIVDAKTLTKLLDVVDKGLTPVKVFHP